MSKDIRIEIDVVDGQLSMAAFDNNHDDKWLCQMETELGEAWQAEANTMLAQGKGNQSATLRQLILALYLKLWEQAI